MKGNAKVKMTTDIEKINKIHSRSKKHPVSVNISEDGDLVVALLDEKEGSWHLVRVIIPSALFTTALKESLPSWIVALLEPEPKKKKKQKEED